LPVGMSFAMSTPAAVAGETFLVNRPSDSVTFRESHTPGLYARLWKVADAE
jgi:hypothetical protein